MTVAKVLRRARANKNWQIVICDNAKVTNSMTTKTIIDNGLYLYHGNKKNIPCDLLKKSLAGSFYNTFAQVAVMKIK